METVFLIILQYIKPHFAVEQYFPKHKVYLDRYVASGHFICCGRKKLKTGEFILCKAADRKAVQQMVSEDPFDEFQLAVYEIVEYNLTASNAGFLSLADQ